jgi:hypothetical protein
MGVLDAKGAGEFQKELGLGEMNSQLRNRTGKGEGAMAESMADDWIDD